MRIQYDASSFGEPVFVCVVGPYVYGPTTNIDDLLFQMFSMWESDGCLWC